MNVRRKKNVLPQRKTRQQQNLAITLPEKTGQHLFLTSPEKGLRLIVARHGETEYNRSGTLQGQRDVPLSPKGKQQAVVLCEWLANQHIDFVLSSPLSRASQLALGIARARRLDVQLVPEFIEMAHGHWEGMQEEKIERRYPNLYCQWKTEPSQTLKPGETARDLQKRVVPAWDQLIEKYGTNGKPLTVLIVAHKWVNQVLLCHVAQLPLDQSVTFKQDNCCINIIDYPEGCVGSAYLRATNLTANELLERIAA